MLATLAIEFSLAIYTVWRYKLTPKTRLITALLVFLGIFQLAEWFVCMNYGFRAEHWARIGFASIATLPPLGLHLMHVLADKPQRRLVWTSYATLAGFIAFIVAYPAAFIGHECTGNYVIFQLNWDVSRAFGTYYYVWLATSIGLGIYWSQQLKQVGKKAQARLQTVQALIVGYLVFLLPVILAISVNPTALDGIPSIMCGFAVLLALILGLYILPRVGELKEQMVLERVKKNR